MHSWASCGGSYPHVNAEATTSEYPVIHPTWLGLLPFIPIACSHHLEISFPVELSQFAFQADISLGFSLGCLLGSPRAVWCGSLRGLIGTVGGYNNSRVRYVDSAVGMESFGQDCMPPCCRSLGLVLILSGVRLRILGSMQRLLLLRNLLCIPPPLSIG